MKQKKVWNGKGNCIPPNETIKMIKHLVLHLIEKAYDLLLKNVKFHWILTCQINRKTFHIFALRDLIPHGNVNYSKIHM